ncbi:P-loop containing nucleoside triphosphate hydrolase protein [Aspergillus terricola var. indicus]
MASKPASAIPLPKPKTETREAFNKRITKALLRYSLRLVNTKVILLLGHLRSGKSSLFEAITGQEGHSANGIDPVTKEYRLGHAHINGEFYLFVDTPGLNETGGNNADILREIGRFLDATKGSVTYAGVLYIHPANVQFSNDCQKALEFLEHFCGLEYSPYITFVTTMWDECNQERAIRRHDENVKQIEERKWAPFIARGAEVYHHGRVYENGEPTLANLDIEKQAAERRSGVRDMIGRVYSRDKEYTVPPLIVQELRAHVPLPATTAGQYLQMTYDQVAITKALSYSAGPIAGIEGSELRNLDEAKDNDSWGFDWIGAAVNAVADAVTFPFRLMQTLLTMLWDLIQILGMMVSIVRVTPYRLTDNGVEARVTLLGGLLAIVGYKRPGGFYWRARESVESSPAEGPDDEFLNDILNELREDSVNGLNLEELPSQTLTAHEELDSEQQYRAFGEAFEQSRSMLGQNKDAQRGDGGCSIM